MKWKGITYRFIRSNLMVLLISMVITFVSIYFGVQLMLQKNIENSLNNSSYLNNEMIKTAADASIKNHLRTTSETYLEITQYYYNQYKQGLMTEEEAKIESMKLISISEVGTTGYVYVVNSKGILVVHPFEEMIGVDISDRSFVQSQINLKDGYVEYDWKNPDDEILREKALYMTWFEPWDWIISASSYREEFLELIKVEDFELQVLGLKFGNDGYPIVLDYEGTFLIHPHQKGRNLIEEKNSQASVIEQSIIQKNGILEYPWKNPDEKKYRQKLTVLSDLPEYKWIIASTAYKEEFYKPLSDLVGLMVGIFIPIIIIAVLVTMKMSITITKPIIKLQKTVLEGVNGDLSTRVELEDDREDEVADLGGYFNQFLEMIEAQSLELKDWNVELEKQVDERTRELYDANLKLVHAEKLESMNELISTIAHNMNTPLGNALMSVSFLGQRVEKLQTVLHNYSIASKEIKALINQLTMAQEGIENNIVKSTSLIEMFKAILKTHNIETIEKFLVRDFVLSIIEKSSLEMDKVKIYCSETLIIDGNMFLLEMILLQLLENAAQHAYADMTFEDIYIEVIEIEDRVLFEVVDHGIGMSTEEIGKVFEPFYSKNKSLDATGLGLTMVYNAVVNVMDGKVEIISTENEGTKIQVNLPKTQAL